MNGFYVLVDGEPVAEPDVLAWAHWFQVSAELRRVARTEVGEEVIISTVFLGLDYSFGGGPPLLYETMVFGGVHDGFQERYASRAEAIAGHAFLLARVREQADGGFVAPLRPIEAGPRRTPDNAAEELVGLARAGDRVGFDALAACLMPAAQIAECWAGARRRLKLLEP